MAKISVIIPTYNRPVQLRRAVESVLQQDLKDFEVIIVDDASDASNHQEIEAVVQLHPSIIMIKQTENVGAAACRNQGIEGSKGNYLLFLDDDDQLLPKMLERLLKEIQEKDVGAVSCRCEMIGEGISSDRLKRYRKEAEVRWDLYDIEKKPLEHLLLYHPQIHSFLVKRESIDSIRFTSGVKYGEDVLFWLQLADHGTTFKRLDFIGCQYLINDNSASAKTAYKEKIAFYRRISNLIDLSSAAKNLCWFRMTVIGLVNIDARFVLWGIRSLAKPVSLYKHLRYYLGLIF